MVTKRELLFLERVFAKEIIGGMLQSKSKIAQKLEDEGYIQKIEKRFTDRLGGFVCTGYVLTFRGNSTYCMSDLCLQANQPATD